MPHLSSVIVVLLLISILLFSSSATLSPFSVLVFSLLQTLLFETQSFWHHWTRKNIESSALLLTCKNRRQDHKSHEKPQFVVVVNSSFCDAEECSVTRTSKHFGLRSDTRLLSRNPWSLFACFIQNNWIEQSLCPDNVLSPFTAEHKGVPIHVHIQATSAYQQLIIQAQRYRPDSLQISLFLVLWLIGTCWLVTSSPITTILTVARTESLMTCCFDSKLNADLKWCCYFLLLK